MIRSTEGLPTDTAGLGLVRFEKAGTPISYETIWFKRGFKGAELMLRQAAISGRVEVEGCIHDHLADAVNVEGDIVGTVALDKGSFAFLKSKYRPKRLWGE